MQTILGANGIIGEELARELRKNYTTKIKLVGRNPEKCIMMINFYSRLIRF
jgi:uncharacterized protein YbjT (DUF2867 family)